MGYLGPLAEWDIKLGLFEPKVLQPSFIFLLRPLLSLK